MKYSSVQNQVLLVPLIIYPSQIRRAKPRLWSAQKNPLLVTGDSGRGSISKPVFSTKQSSRFESNEMPGKLVAGRFDPTPTPDTRLLLPSGISVVGIESCVRKLAGVA